MLQLDGSQGEGGGQILRTALSLAVCTGTPILIDNIRAKRAKPGLMRQHLTAVSAAAEICGAEVEGAQAGSQRLRFVPGPIKAGHYRFAIGTAGSCTLVLQTILPALLRADGPSTVVLHGGTHNPLAPPFHFLQRAFLPLLLRMGAQVSLELARFGFFPVGGGEMIANVEPAPKLASLHLPARGAAVAAYAEAYIAALPAHIAERELDVVSRRLGWSGEQLRLCPLANHYGPGNILLITLQHQHVTEVFAGFGEKGVPAETVAEQTVENARQYLASGAAVGPHLADQLLLPMALAGAGSFTTSELTRHTLTNADVIRKFLPVEIDITETGAQQHAVRVSS